MNVGVQGEVIEQQFGEKELCFRTLDLYTSAVLEASLNPTTPPKPEWRQAMDRMSQVTAPASACCTLPPACALPRVPIILPCCLSLQQCGFCELATVWCSSHAFCLRGCCALSLVCE